MRKIQLLALAGLAVFAFSAIAASSALAKEWLWNGAAITGLLASVTTGELLLEDTKAFVKIDVLCSGTFIGSVGPGAEDEITLVEGLKGEDNAIKCTAHSLCEPAEVTVTAVNLPWKSLIVLMEGAETILDVVTGTGGEPGYNVACKTILGTFEDKCTAEAGGEQSLLKNETADVFGEFSESETTTPPGKCSLGGTKSGLVVGSGLTTATEGGTLSIS